MSSYSEYDFIHHRNAMLLIIDNIFELIKDFQSFFGAEKCRITFFDYNYDESESLAKTFKILNFINLESIKLKNFSQITFQNFENDLNNIWNHLDKLKNRVLDNNSKVLITGDLNAGKSTIINALLQQNILPTDQQPCTQSFCELIPVNNKNLSGKIFGYESTVINENSISILLEAEQLRFEIQSENSKYNWFKIYISNSEYDQYEESEITVSFIDSPGLNTDLFKTTSLFNQQHDIDVIVFVINAAFHLTLSGKEFLDTAAKEKEKIFFIVNKFDEIENPEKCKNVILKQIKEILPETFEDAPDLIHFTSAREYLRQVSILKSNEFIKVNGIKVNSEDEDKKQMIEPIKLNAEFECMKTSLLNYIYLKRSQSKFSPAKTYTTRLLQDFLELSSIYINHTTEKLLTKNTKIQEFAPLISKKESETTVLNRALNEVVKNYSEKCFFEVKNLAEGYSDEIPKIFSSHPFTSIWKLRYFINNIYYRVSNRYLETLTDIEIVTSNYKQKGHNELASISHRFESPINQAPDSIKEFSLCPSSPIRQPSILELIGTYEVLGSIGSLNLTSIVGFAIGYQPLMSLLIRTTKRMRLSPMIVATIVFGGISAYAIYTASSTVEKVVRKRLESYFVTRFNKEFWVNDLADRCRQSVSIYLSGESSQIYTNYQRILDENRQEIEKCYSESIQLNSNILKFKEMKVKIEMLLKSCSKIKL